MRAILRGMAVLLAGGLWLLPASAFAQDATQPAINNTTAPTAVGPSELQDFSLSGNVTKPSEQKATAPAVAAPSPATGSAQSADSTQPVRRITQTREAARETPPPAAAPIRLPAVQTQPTASAPAISAPAQANRPSVAPPTSAAPSLPPTSAAGLVPEHKLSILPWFIAALALAGGTMFLLWRRRPREALSGPEFDHFSAPEPAPAPTAEPVRVPVRDPVPAPAPPKPSAPAASGIVASRLRPALELGVQPLRCLVEDSQVTIEFEIELFNAGTAPARAVLAEASLLNAGATQDQELSAFFANPVGAGERLDAIPPMRRINLTSRVVAPRGAIQEYELAGRKAFVPVIAFNALYEWSGGKAQTSAAYLVGRDTRSEKLGPLHLDQGSRAFTTLAARELPATVRT